VHQARESVAGITADAEAVVPVLLVEQDRGGCWGGMVTGLAEAVAQLLDTGLMRQRGIGVGRIGRGIGGIGAAPPVDLIDLFRLRVVRFEIVVGDWPGGRQTVIVFEVPEIFTA
jgi:hypothetical protein